MKEAKLVINVWHKDTKWGDSIFFYCNAAHWKRATRLTTSAESFPWWHGEVVINMETFPNNTIEFKMAIWRDGYEIWEQFKGNRTTTIAAGATQNIAVKFGELTWTCPLCATALDEIPVLCSQQHPMHLECFEQYATNELQNKRTKFCCMRCAKSFPDTWQSQVSASVLRRFQRVCAEEDGGTALTCPMASCDFEVVYAAGESIPDNEHCTKCGVTWCTKCNRLGTWADGGCQVCRNGLKDVADMVYDALEEVAGAKCPSCSQRGQKLPSECTHITCDCGEVFCYCCGLPGSEVDTSDDYASTDMDRLYGHNDDYHEKPTRCPMWLVNYADIYVDWPEDVDDAQENFHGMRASNKLRDVKDKVTQHQWDSFLDTNDNVKSLVEMYMKKTFTSSCY